MGLQRAELTQAHTSARGREIADIQALYREQAERLGRLAFLLSGDNEEARELVQEAFARLISRRRTIKDPDAVDGYVRATIVNLARKNWRRKATERRYLQLRRLWERDASAPPPDFETTDQLREVLRTLSFRQQAAIILRYYEDLPERDIAELMGCAVGTVKSALSRGLEAMKIELEGERDE